MLRKLVSAVALPLSLILPAAAAEEEKEAPKATTECTMTFNLKGWSAFYKTAKGEGTISCDNGQSRAVTLSAKGGGVTFGKSEIVDGTGDFTEVPDIEDLFGTYVSAEAHAGAGKSSKATVMTKGEVSLAIAGTGRGVDIGFGFGKFVITPK